MKDFKNYKCLETVQSKVDITAGLVDICRKRTVRFLSGLSLSKVITLSSVMGV